MRSIVFVYFKMVEKVPQFHSYCIAEMDTLDILKHGNSVKSMYETMCAFKAGKIVTNINAESTRKLLRKQGLNISDNKFIDTLWDFIELPELRHIAVNKLLILFDMPFVESTNLSMSAKSMAQLCILCAKNGLVGKAVLDDMLTRLFEYMLRPTTLYRIHYSKINTAHSCISSLLPYSSLGLNGIEFKKSDSILRSFVDVCMLSKYVNGRVSVSARCLERLEAFIDICVNIDKNLCDDLRELFRDVKYPNRTVKHEAERILSNLPY